MTDFTSVAPGDPVATSPPRQASWINAVSAAASRYQNQIAGGTPHGQSLEYFTSQAIVRVDPTPLMLVDPEIAERGSVVELKSYTLDPVDPRHFWFDCEKVQDPPGDKLAILRTSIGTGPQVPIDAQVIGVTTVWVDVKDTQHTHCKAVAGELAAESSSSGFARILSTLTQTGKQEVAALLGEPKAPPALEIALAIDSIPVATADGDEITPGWQPDAIKVFQWSDPRDKLVKSVDEFDQEILIAGINLSFTEIRATATDPVVVVGYRETIHDGVEDIDAFLAVNVMDFRALPGYFKGNAPTPPDDPDLLIPYKSGGDEDFKLASRECNQ